MHMVVNDVVMVMWHIEFHGFCTLTSLETFKSLAEVAWTWMEYLTRWCERHTSNRRRSHSTYPTWLYSGRWQRIIEGIFINERIKNSERVVGAVVLWSDAVRMKRWTGIGRGMVNSVVVCGFQRLPYLTRYGLGVSRLSPPYEIFVPSTRKADQLRRGRWARVFFDIWCSAYSSPSPRFVSPPGSGILSPDFLRIFYIYMFAI